MSNINKNEKKYPIISLLSGIFNKSTSIIGNITNFLLSNTYIIEKIRKFSLLSIGILSAVSLSDLYITCNTYSLNITYNSIGIYLLIDTLFVKNEFILHHIFVNQLFLLSIYYKINIYDILPLIKFLIMTEISSIFLVFRHLFTILDIYFDKLIDKSKYYNKIKLVNDILFFISFFITRIVNYYLFIIKNNTIQNIITMYYGNSYISYYVIYTSLYGLYVINLYWFGLILMEISNIIIKKRVN